MTGLTEDELVEDVDEVCFGQGISLVLKTLCADDVMVIATARDLVVRDTQSVCLVTNLFFFLMSFSTPSAG